MKLESIKQTLEYIVNNCPTEELEDLKSELSKLDIIVNSYSKEVSELLNIKLLEKYKTEETLAILQKEFSNLEWEVYPYLDWNFIRYQGKGSSLLIEVEFYTSTSEWKSSVYICNGNLVEDTDKVSNLDELIKATKQALKPLKEIADIVNCLLKD